MAFGSLAAHAQTPVINSITVKNTGCTYTPGISTQPCDIAPGMVVVINGANFGSVPGLVDLTDGPASMNKQWTPTEVVVRVDWIGAGGGIVMELPGGQWSNWVPYNALAPVITRIEDGSCSYVPNVSSSQCAIAPGDTVTIYGNYFGPGWPGGGDNNGEQVGSCECNDATWISWDPDWGTNSSPKGNKIVAVINQTAPGASITVQSNYMWSNPVPYAAENGCSQQ